MYRNKDTNYQRGAFGLVFGRPGVGKTSFLVHDPKSFFIGNELNKEFKPKGMIPCKNWAQFKTQLSCFLTDYTAKTELQEEFDTLVIDNFSDMEELMIKSFIGNANLATWNTGYGAGRDECRKRTKNILDEYIIPLQELNMHVVFICHEKEKEETDYISGVNITKYKPFLEDKTLKPLESHADFIFHLKSGNVKIKGKQKIMLYTDSTINSYAKKKSYIKIPDEIDVTNKEKLIWLKIKSKLLI